MTQKSGFTILPVSGRFEIDYVNSKNERSTRIIDIKQFVVDSPDGFINAYCHQRKMARTFNYAAMRRVIDTETGEIIAPDKLHLYLLDLYRKSPARTIDLFIDDMRPIIEVLVYIAWCDGKYLPSEQKKIVHWILSESSLPDDLSDYSLAVVKKWPIPDGSVFAESARTINRDWPEWKEAVIQHAQGVAAADRKITEEETECLTALKELFGMGDSR